MLYFCSTLEEYKTLKSKLSPKSVGLVPTMGNLHEGHLGLLRAAIDENDLTALTIYVNPTQFAQGEDFEDYPRTLEEDLAQVEKTLEKAKADPNVVVFAPKTDEEIYPKGASKDKLSAGKLGKILEGELRPGHFDGVVTVVHRLFTMFSPSNAYFGKKDYQQLAVIKEMASAQKHKIKIHGLPTARESSGLALSSRNSFLSESEKSKGLKLYQTLLKIQKVLEVERDLQAAQELVSREMENDASFNYLAIRDAESLEAPKELKFPLVALGNYQVGKVRLLDNLEVEAK